MNSSNSSSDSSSLAQTITVWIDQLRSGDAKAAQRLWEAYFQRMVDLARRKLEGASKAVADEEDVALSAFKSFCIGAREGRFTQLLDRNNLWPLLMVITANKSVDFLRGENRQKRGGSGHAADQDPSAFPARSASPVALGEILSREPTPDFAVEMSDQLERLLSRLDSTGDLDLRQIALLKMQGYKTPEIAEQIGCVSRTIERKIQVIARLWQKDVES